MRKSATALFAILSSTLLAQEVDVPLRNWTVPPYALSGAAGGLAPMTDIWAPRAFVPVAPCRVADTRGNGFTGQAGPPALTTSPRMFVISGNVPGVPLQCGIPPAGTTAVSVQLTIVLPSAAGNLVAWVDGPAPTVSVLNWSAGETALGNGTIVPMNDGGGFFVKLNAATPINAHLVIDVNGYFSPTTQTPNSFWVSSPSVPAIIGENTATSGVPIGVWGRISPLGGPTQGAVADGSTGDGYRPSGTGLDGWGVYGSSTSGRGVFGEATVGFGVWGQADLGMGVVGSSLGTGGNQYGVWAQTESESGNSAGLRAHDGGGEVVGTHSSAGVRGETAGAGIGVYGLTTNGYAGVSGYRVSAMGAIGTGASLGFTSLIGLHVSGNTQVNGTKAFIEPHPSDASKIIRYISLEGNEAGTYFRGRGKFQNGVAVIEVPEDFRIVTDPEGLSIQVTPIGEMATVAVQSIGLERIVVRGSRNVEFFFTVNGIRHAYRDIGPIAENEKAFVPRTSEERIPEYLPEALRRRLIQNGTYREDGTVNPETARRLGWDRVWAERERPAPE